MALIGPPGFYLRNDTIYFEGQIGSVTLGDRIYSSASQDVWINTVKGIYLAEGGLFGGRLGTNRFDSDCLVVSVAFKF